MTPRISVVCPTYNAGQYIVRTVQVLLKQTFKPFEVIFADDGSLDNTVALLKPFEQFFLDQGVGFVLIENQHVGPGEARNTGIRRASGDWIAFLDADDLWVDSKLARVAETIARNAKTNCVLHWENYVRLDGQNSVLQHGAHYNPQESLSQQLYRSNFFSTSAVVLQKPLLQKCLFDATLPISQDYELWLRLSQQLNLTVLPEVLGSYVELEASITAKPYYRRYYHLMRILWRHRRLGGWHLFWYRVARATASPQWVRWLLNLLRRKQRH